MNDAVKLLRGLVVDRDQRWGDVAAEFQLEDAEAILSTDPAAPRLHFVTRPRGGSKTTDAAGVALAAMLTQLPRHARAYAAAADEDQARRLVDAAHRLVLQTPGMAGALRLEQGRVVAHNRGVTLDALAADGPGAYGLLPHLVVVDELGQWPTTRGARGFWTALVSAMGKVPGARLVVLTSAGDPAHWSAKVRDQAARSAQWRLSETPGPLAWVSPAALEEQRALLLPSEFARLHMNVWTAADDRLTTAEDLAACVVLDGPQDPERGRAYVIGVDLGLSNDATVAAVCHAESWPVSWAGQWRRPEVGQRVALDRMAVWHGSRVRKVKLSDVEEWLLQASRHFAGAEIVMDPWQAVGMAQRLRDRGVRVHEFGFSSASVGRLASTLYQLLSNRALMLPDDRDLLDELVNVRLRETSPGVLRMDHDSGRHDDRAIALSLAATHLLSKPPQYAGPLQVIDRRLASRGRGAAGSDLRRDPVLLELAKLGDPEATRVLKEVSRTSARPRSARFR
jgi:phage terminase large subunit-like protein